jgi:hypothetical protein
MKKLILVFAAFALSVASHQAVACDWGAHAANKNATVVVCDHSGCAAAPTAQQAAATQPTTPKVANETANPVPLTVADQRN